MGRYRIKEDCIEFLCDLGHLVLVVEKPEVYGGSGYQALESNRERLQGMADRLAKDCGGAGHEKKH